MSLTKKYTGNRRHVPMRIKTGLFSSEIVLVLQQEYHEVGIFYHNPMDGVPMYIDKYDWENVNTVDELRTDTSLEVQYLLQRVKYLENRPNFINLDSLDVELVEVVNTDFGNCVDVNVKTADGRYCILSCTTSQARLIADVIDVSLNKRTKA